MRNVGFSCNGWVKSGTYDYTSLKVLLLDKDSFLEEQLHQITQLFLHNKFYWWNCSLHFRFHSEELLDWCGVCLEHQNL